MPPIQRLSRRRSCITSGSTSAPARKVRTILAKLARKSIHGVLCSPKPLAATTPNTISIRATEIPSSTDAMLATRIKMPMTMAIQAFSISPFRRVRPRAAVRAIRLGAPDPSAPARPAIASSARRQLSPSWPTGSVANR